MSREVAPDLVEVVHHGDDGAAFAMPGGDQCQKYFDGSGVDRGEGFIQQDDLGVEQQQAGEEGPAHLAD